MYGAFGDDDDLLIALADAAERLAGQDWDRDALLDSAMTDGTATWVVVTPVVGAEVPEEVVLLDGELALAPAGDWSHGSVDRRAIKSQLRGLFGVEADPGARFVHGGNDHLLDTRRTASLVSRHVGSRARARGRGLEQARLAIAGWTLLAPPESDHYTPMWPQVTEWQPQASLHIEAPSYRVNDNGTSTRRGGATIVHAPDAGVLWPWPERALVDQVIRAIRAVERSRGACALLSAAWNLYLAARAPTDNAWIERLVHVMHAREALCEPTDRRIQTVDKRFDVACSSLSVLDGLTARGWGAGDLSRINGPFKRLRHLGVHGSDVSLLRLGYPAGRRRIKVESERLAPIYIREAVSPAFHAVRELAVRLWEIMDQCDYDDATFERCFVRAPNDGTANVNPDDGDR